MILSSSIQSSASVSGRLISRLSVAILGLCAMLMVGIAQAETRIAYVDAVRLLEQSPQSKKQQQALEAKFAGRNRELRAKFDLLRAKEADYKKNEVTLSNDQKQKLRDEIIDMQRDIKREEENYTADLRQARRKGIGELEKVISEAIFTVAKREGYDLVLREVVYASKDIDITSAVLSELGK